MSEPGWWRPILNRRMLICVFTGFSSGMPLYVLLQLIPAWLRDDGVSLVDIGLFALVGIPYTWKFLWAPLMDRYVPLALGRRRGWMLLSQVALLISIATLGLLQPQQSLQLVAAMAVLIAILSASQDIVLDAYRREILPDNELGLGNSIHVQAYRISSLVPGSLSLILADFLAWEWVFLSTGAFMACGILLTLFVKEANIAREQGSSIVDSVRAPFTEYLARRGRRGMLLVFSFLVFYKLGDSMATALSTPFYMDLGFTKSHIGLVAKNAALWPSIVGGILGGILMLRIGINRALWLFGLLQFASIFGFALLAETGPVLWLLGAVIAFEYLGVGLGTAAFTGYIARETSRQYAATQFALFTAITALPRTFSNAATGVIVETIGWTSFFLFCAALAIPGLLMLRWVAPWSEPVDKGTTVPRVRV